MRDRATAATDGNRRGLSAPPPTPAAAALRPIAICTRDRRTHNDGTALCNKQHLGLEHGKDSKESRGLHSTRGQRRARAGALCVYICAARACNGRAESAAGPARKGTAEAGLAGATGVCRPVDLGRAGAAARRPRKAGRERSGRLGGRGVRRGGGRGAIRGGGVKLFSGPRVGVVSDAGCGAVDVQRTCSSNRREVHTAEGRYGRGRWGGDGSGSRGGWTVSMCSPESAGVRAVPT